MNPEPNLIPRWRRLGAILFVAALGVTGAARGKGVDQALLDAVAAGDPQAQFRLGLAHLQVINEERNLEEGIKWILAAARSGYSPARTYLAEFYMSGTVVPYQPDTAFRLLLESALEQQLAAAYGVAQCYRHGIGVERDTKKAETWFARASAAASVAEDSLDGESLRTIGLCHRDGHGVPRNYPEAARWLLKAARADNPRALFELGNFYAYGLGVPQDDRKAFALHIRAAYAGSGQACLAVSRRYRDGNGVATDPDQAAAWSQRALQQLETEAGLGNLDAATDLYLYCSRGVFEKDPERARKWLDVAVAKGYPRALTFHGESLATGAGIEKDMAKAETVLQAAAAAHQSGAHYLLHQLYLHGDGIERDPGRALQHLRSAAECGNVTAMSRIADWYVAHPDQENAASQAEAWRTRALEENTRLAERDQIQAQLALVTVYGRGRGVAKDETKVLYWLRRAAEAGHDEAQYMIANAYDRGLGLDADPEQALHWYRRAAEQEYVPAMLSLATVYQRGELGVARSAAKSQEWYDRTFAVAEEAARAGDRDAAYMMATCYREGLGREPNPSQVLHWLHRAAELGDPKACVQLSRIYTEGREVIRNSDEAYRLLCRAVEGGDPEARFLLARLYDEGDYVDRDYQRAYELYYLAAASGFSPAKVLLQEMEVTLGSAVMRRARASADAILRDERLRAGDVSVLE